MKIPGVVRQTARMLSSLRLTVILLALSLILVFFGTLDQVRIGIREAQILYFESFLAFWQYPETWPGHQYIGWLRIPMPGGYLLGPLLTINLIAGHISYFRWRWTIIGTSLIHGGVVLLLINQLLTNFMQKDSYLWLDEGESANYVESRSEDELVLSQRGEDGNIRYISFDYDDLKNGRQLNAAPFPIRLQILEAFDNANIQPSSGNSATKYQIDRGIGADFRLGVEKRERFRGDEQRDVRAAVVELLTEQGSEGTWLISSVFEDRFAPQEFSYAGNIYTISMRFKRTYMPFTLSLIDFKHEKYPGTEIPMNFSSRVHLQHPEKGIDEELSIYMNNPLRYEGLTFFQASFAKQDTASMFHVVANPGWRIPYIACILVSLGLVYQFSVVALRRLWSDK